MSRFMGKTSCATEKVRDVFCKPSDIQMKLAASNEKNIVSAGMIILLILELYAYLLCIAWKESVLYPEPDSHTCATLKIHQLHEYK